MGVKNNKKVNFHISDICGYEYTSKLTRMFHDIALSKTLNEEFRKRLTDNGKEIPIDFSIKLLTMGSWPFTQSFPLTLPKEFDQALHHFQEFYNEKHHGRKLTWLYSQSKVKK